MQQTYFAEDIRRVKKGVEGQGVCKFLNPFCETFGYNLLKVGGRQELASLPQMHPVLLAIEAIFNSRPIAPLSSDPNDCKALIPAHFIIGNSLKALPERAIVAENDINHHDEWSCIIAVKQRFWHQCSREYLSELQSRTKWVRDQPNIQVNALVITHEDNMPPQHWITGRVISVIPGKDNRVRVVEVKTPKCIMRRPIHKLALLLV
ncbi:uncharacterized protein LOC119667332 [Teleopsis dalmanni]|uniref:uncharacterized protein LOC119667332 n=1 Tax=Teleopsis dalmanni TaxID=139649 RepID=UPI0018CCB8AD|nr:uncharacterized protein LOC119667332 [Teleopsis dalmanni]